MFKVGQFVRSVKMLFNKIKFTGQHFDCSQTNNRMKEQKMEYKTPIIAVLSTTSETCVSQWNSSERQVT